MFTEGSIMTLAAEVEEIVEIPDGITVEVDGLKVTIKGPKGSLTREFKTKEEIHIDKVDNKIRIWARFPRRKTLAMMGTIRAHIKNMITGVTKGYKYTLKVHYRHFPMNVSVEGNKVVIKNFLGEKSNRYANIVGNTKVEVKGKDTIIVTGINKEEVGQTAANIEQATYAKNRDPRVFIDGIYIVEKGEGE